MINVMSWILLAIAALLFLVSLYSVTTGLSAYAKGRDCPYTAGSVRQVSRWIALSALVMGLGFAGCGLLTGVLFRIGSFTCTVGMLVLPLCFGLSHIISMRARRTYVRKTAAAAA